MHSYVNRRSTQKVLDSLENYPVVALLGARQVGKSTLAKHIGAGFQDTVYLDLESPRDINKLQDPEAFFELNRDSLICLDEIQRMPDLFEVLRAVVDKTKQRFLVLGSASRDLIRQSSETLAGRIAYLELTPFTLDEIPGGDSKTHWLRGGYPRSVLAKNDEVSFEWRLNYIRTFLERDIPQLGFNIPANTLQRLWQMLAHNQGQTLNSAKLGNSLDKSANTVRHYIDILEQTFLVRTLAPYSVNVKKRLVKSPKVYLRDSGLLHGLLDIETMNSLMGHPVYGSSYEGYVIENILVNLPRWKPYFYRTAGGAELDLVLSRGTEIIAIEIKASSAPKPSRGFWSSCEDIKATRKYVIGAVETAYPIKNGALVCGINEFIQVLARG
jgi:predicted AAA+ superfamily ATPase